MASVIIPARLESTRLPRKVLLDINGRPMFYRVVERARRAKKISRVYLATGEEEIVEAATQLRCDVLVTKKVHRSGTGRVAEAARMVDEDIIINVQADEPLISPETIDALVDYITERRDISIATIVKKCDEGERIDDPNIVKVAVDHFGNALYFSRAAIPFGGIPADREAYLKHLGIYAYRRGFLLSFQHLKESHLERSEKLEQLRILANGYKIGVLETSEDSIGVDTREEYEEVKRIYNERR